VKKGYTGAPVDPSPYTLTQPDGSTLRVHPFGDHLSNGVATVKGDYTVVKGGDGFWRYAAGLTSSGKLKPSNVIAGDGTPPAAAQHLAPAPSAKAVQAQTPPAGTGDDKELVILVQFSDQKSVGSTEAQWHEHYFGDTASVDDFYEEASTNKFGLAPAAETCGTADNGVTNWLTLPYDHPNTGVDTAVGEDYIADAIELASSCVNYAAFDGTAGHPADGQITTDELHITVIGAGYETSYGGPTAQCGPSIWGHEWDLDSAGLGGVTTGGVVVGASGYTTFGEWHCKQATDNPGHKATIGIMAHEFGHDINWPDLYDTDGSGEGLGEFSLMAGGSWGKDAGGVPGASPTWPDAFALYYQGWVTPTPVTTATNDIALAPHQSLLLGPNPLNVNWIFNETEGDGEYFLAELRNHTGYDRSTPGCGVVVYRVDETVTPSNAANNSTTDPLVKVIQADGLDELTTGHNDRGDTGDPYPGSTNNHDLNNTTTPNTRFHDNVASNLSLHVDESDPGTTCLSTMHVDVLQPGGASTPVTRPGNDLFANAVTIGGTTGSVSGHTEHATTEAEEPVPAGCGRASVWYRWTAPGTGTATITTADSDYDTVLGIFTGSAVNALTLVAANDDEDHANEVYTSKVTTPVTAGTTYQIAADGCAGDSGALKLAWDLVSPGATTSMVTATHTPDPSFGGSVSAINVTVAGAGGTPTGTAVVKEGEKVIGSTTLDAQGKGSVALPANTPVGAHALTVQYGGNAEYKTAAGTVTANVLAPPVPTKVATTTSASAPKKVRFKKNFDVKASVAAASGAATGTVQVLDGSKVIGTGTLANGAVTIHVTKNLKPGKHTLTVTYAGSTTTLASQTTVKVKVLKKKKRHHHH
jgi:M6 family metalloprotease-like protein